MIADDLAPWLVAGLGNPDPEYAGNRHNVGFLVADVLAARYRITPRRHRRVPALAGEGRLGLAGPRLVIVKPLTYMNLSGSAVAGLARFYKVPVDRIVAVHDDIDLDFGQIRVKLGGGEGGHNGLRSVTQSLGSRDYLRVRFGVGRPPGRQDAADFVLSNFTSAERKELEYLVDRAADAAESLIGHGVEWTQNAFHGR